MNASHLPSFRGRPGPDPPGAFVHLTNCANCGRMGEIDRMVKGGAMVDKARIRELLALLIESRNKNKRREYVAVLYELLRPVLESKND